jgi:hypothetical protein
MHQFSSAVCLKSDEDEIRGMAGELKNPGATFGTSTF